MKRCKRPIPLECSRIWEGTPSATLNDVGKVCAALESAIAEADDNWDSCDIVVEIVLNTFTKEDGVAAR
jgi:hypothetical protein